MSVREKSVAIALPVEQSSSLTYGGQVHESLASFGTPPLEHVRLEDRVVQEEPVQYCPNGQPLGRKIKSNYLY